MRSERTIANEIDVKRSDLAHDLSQLKEVVDEKVDVVKRVRASIVQKRLQAVEAGEITRALIRAHPPTAIVISFGLGALLALVRSR